MEKRCKEWIEKNVVKIACVCALILGVIVRISFRKFLSGDARNCLVPWYQMIKDNGGIKGLGTQVGNYNLLYQFFIAVFTYIPLNALTLYKAFSCIFDVALAVMGVIYVEKIWKKGEWKGCMAFICIFLSPIVVLNSSLWAQCDSIYTFFCIVTLYLLFKERFWLAMISFGIAFAFKIQTIFILPFLLVYYIINKKFSVKYFVGTVAAMFALAIPGLLNGRSIFDIFVVYKGQIMDSPDWILYNYPGICNLFVNDQSPVEYIRYVKILCIVVAIGVIGCIGAWIIYNKVEMSAYNYTYLAFLLTYSGVLFMPAMHERYGYIYEILAILIAIHDMKTIVGCLAIQLCTLISYSYYLFGIEYDARLLTIINLIVFISYLIYFIWRQKFNEEKD